jgi:hypothetical protein
MATGGGTSIGAWIALYVVHTAWWLFVATRPGGLPGWLIDPLASRWSREAVKLFAWLWLVAGTLWFVLGIFDPAVRLAWPS